MLLKCCVTNCKANYATSDEHVVVCRLPSDATDRQQWIQNIPRENIPDSRHTMTRSIGLLDMQKLECSVKNVQFCLRLYLKTSLKIKFLLLNQNYKSQKSHCHQLEAFYLISWRSSGSVIS